jgi:aminomethyltransferase
VGGLTGLQIFPDDEIEIINEEGNQICEIICFDKDGKSELRNIKFKRKYKKSFIKEILNKR